MKDEINIKIPGQILDYVDTKEHLLELFNYITNLKDYKLRNEKAIEYIKNKQELNKMFGTITLSKNSQNELLSILNGGDDNDRLE